MMSVDRTRQRGDIVLLRQTRFYIHLIYDIGPLAALSVESDQTRYVTLHSGQVMDILPNELKTVYEQLGWPPPGGAQSTPVMTETRPTPEPEPVAVEPPSAPEPVVITQTVEVDNPEHVATIDAQAQRIAELEAALAAAQAVPEPVPEPEPEAVEMPEALAEFSEADESVADLRARFFIELGNLRSMAVSKHPDFIAKNSNLPRLLNILESDVAQRWMLSTTS